MHCFFKYSKDCQYVGKDQFTDAEFIELLKFQLSNVGPVIYSGYEDNMGHAFVCDGYDIDNLIHCNFGWDGVNNGYYDITELFPKNAGIVINIVPDRSSSEQVDVFADRFIYRESHDHLFYVAMDKHEDGSLWGNTTPMYFYAPERFEGSIGIALINDRNELEQIIQTKNISSNGYYFYNSPITFNNFEIPRDINSCSFSLVYQHSGEKTWHPIQNRLGLDTQIPVADNWPMINVTWNVDPRINIHQDLEYMCNHVLDFSNGYPKKLRKHETYYFNVLFPEGLQCKVSGTGMGLPGIWIYEDVNQGEFSIDTKEDREICVDIIDEECISLIVDDDNPPINVEYEKIRELKWNKEIGFFDSMDITNYMPGLKILDLSEATDKGFWYQSLGFLQYLEEFSYPKNVTSIWGYNTGHSYQLTTIELPSSLQTIDEFLWEGEKPRKIICHSINPPEFTNVNFMDPYIYKKMERSILMVPKGCKEIYKEAEGWKLFGSIVEFDKDWRDFIFVESIEIDPVTWTGREWNSFQINATVLPENATEKTLKWTSSNGYVARADDSGKVQVDYPGQCTITVSTTDGSNLSAECKINVYSDSGIEDIFADDVATVDVYDMKGILLIKDCDRQELQRLAPGMYIIRDKTETVKIVIK